MKNPPEEQSGRTDPQTTPPVAEPQAPPVRLRDADGREVEGWAVRRDLVVARCSGMRQPVAVTVAARETTGTAVYERAVEADGGSTWTAVILPEGTLPLEGDLLPPGFDRLALATSHLKTTSVKGLGAHRTEAPAHVTRSLWCSIFPRASGC